MVDSSTPETKPDRKIRKQRERRAELNDDLKKTGIKLARSKRNSRASLSSAQKRKRSNELDNGLKSAKARVARSGKDSTLVKQLKSLGRIPSAAEVSLLKRELDSQTHKDYVTSSKEVALAAMGGSRSSKDSSDSDDECI